jgi:hypothetical protein
MVTTIDSGQRNARKDYRCGLCGTRIHRGDRHAFQTNVYDGRVYTWRDCLACDRDGVLSFVSDWDGGWSDEGVDYEKAVEWADQAVAWPRNWLTWGRSIHPAERLAARNWLARAAGDE